MEGYRHSGRVVRTGGFAGGREIQWDDEQEWHLSDERHKDETYVAFMLHIVLLYFKSGLTRVWNISKRRHLYLETTKRTSIRPAWCWSRMEDHMVSTLDTGHMNNIGQNYTELFAAVIMGFLANMKVGKLVLRMLLYCMGIRKHNLCCGVTSDNCHFVRVSISAYTT